MKNLILKMAIEYRMAEVVSRSNGCFNYMTLKQANAILSDTRYQAAVYAWE